jgi:hypothetical protein
MGSLSPLGRLVGMTTLRIEHAVTEFATWCAAFDRFAGLREQAGVLSYRIWRPVDDERYVTLDLDFAERDSAEAFLSVLRERVWAIPANSPALLGAPSTQILEPADRLRRGAGGGA